MATSQTFPYAGFEVRGFGQGAFGSRLEFSYVPAFASKDQVGEYVQALDYGEGAGSEKLAACA